MNLENKQSKQRNPVEEAKESLARLMLAVEERIKNPSTNISNEIEDLELAVTSILGTTED